MKFLIMEAVFEYPERTLAEIGRQYALASPSYYLKRKRLPS